MFFSYDLKNVDHVSPMLETLFKELDAKESARLEREHHSCTNVENKPKAIGE